MRRSEHLYGLFANTNTRRREEQQALVVYHSEKMGQWR